MEHKSKADQPTKYQTSLAIINWHGYPAIGLTTRGDTMNFFRGYAPDGPCQAMTALLAEFFFDNPKL